MKLKTILFETLLFENLLPNSKLITLEAICRPPSQSNFLEVLNYNMNKIDSVINEVYILNDFNLNVYLNNSYRPEKNVFNKRSVPVEIYHKFRT